MNAKINTYAIVNAKNEVCMVCEAPETSYLWHAQMNSQAVIQSLTLSWKAVLVAIDRKPVCSAAAARVMSCPVNRRILAQDMERRVA